MKKYISILILFSVLCTQNIVFAIKQEDITVKAEKQILKSRLKKEYVGYSYKITNNSKSTINIVNAQNVANRVCVVMNTWYRPISEGPKTRDSMTFINILNTIRPKDATMLKIVDCLKFIS